MTVEGPISAPVEKQPATYSTQTTWVKGVFWKRASIPSNPEIQTKLVDRSQSATTSPFSLQGCGPKACAQLSAQLAADSLHSSYQLVMHELAEKIAECRGSGTLSGPGTTVTVQRKSSKEAEHIEAVLLQNPPDPEKALDVTTATLTQPTERTTREDLSDEPFIVCGENLGTEQGTSYSYTRNSTQTTRPCQ